MMPELFGFAVYFCGAMVCAYYAKVLLSSILGSGDARRAMRHNSGINIVHGAKGNQTGELVPDKRVSRGLFD